MEHWYSIYINIYIYVLLCCVYLIYYTDSSGRSVSTVSAGGWSNAGCKTYRGFRVNKNYYLRAGMNCGGVSVGRRWWHRRPGTRKPGTMYIRAKKKNTSDTGEIQRSDLPQWWDATRLHIICGRRTRSSAFLYKVPRSRSYRPERRRLVYPKLRVRVIVCGVEVGRYLLRRRAAKRAERTAERHLCGSPRKPRDSAT